MPFPAPARRGAAGTVRASHSTLRADGENPSHSRPHRADAPAAKTVERAGRSGGGPDRSHGSPGCVEVLPDLPAYSTARGPFQAPGLLGEGPEVGRRSFAPASGPSPALGPPGVGLREQWTSVASGPAGGAAPALGQERRAGALLRVCGPPPEERASPRAAQPPPESAGSRRARDPRSSAQDPLSGSGAFVPLTNPLHHAGQRKGKPAPGARILGAPQSRSSPNYSQSGSRTSGWVTEQSAKSFPPLEPGDTPPRAKLTSALRAAGSGTRSKSQHHAWSLRGLPVTLASLRQARREDGRKEESDLKSHSSSLPPSENVAGSAAGGTGAAQPPHAGTGSAARPASLGAKRLVS